MEIILVLVALGLIAYWVYSTSQKRKEESTAAEATQVQTPAPYKVETPVLATPVVEESVKIIVQEPLVVAEATPATVAPAKKPRAKKAPAAKTAAKPKAAPKAAAATAKPKAKKPTIKIAK